MNRQGPLTRGQDPYAAAFAPLDAIQRNTSGLLENLTQLRQLNQQPQLMQQQSQDSLLRSVGDLLPPEVLQYIIQSRLPGLQLNSPIAGPAIPGAPAAPNITPEQVAMFQQMLAQ